MVMQLECRHCVQGSAWAGPAATRVPESGGNPPCLQRQGGQRWVCLGYYRRSIGHLLFYYGIDIGIAICNLWWAKLQLLR